MKIAFHSADCPSLDFDSLASLANRNSFDGVQLEASADSKSSNSNALLTSPSKVHQTFANAGIEISAIDIGSDFDQLASRIALAIELHCSLVCMKSDSLFTRTGGTETGTIDMLLSAADVAAKAGVSILIENQPVTGSALRLWHLLDRLNHPSIACCWNTMSAARAADSPAVAVPTLNSRIRYVILQDAKKNESTFTESNLGEGDLPLRKTTDRLRGIGFDGWLVVRNAPQPDPKQFEQALVSARNVLQQWQILPKTVAR